ncbi:MAG: GNAT family N-acetyltransferase [Chloroflexi bacterium]|nr:GNAT family N-acetyltransferase [Chloroflexota bacterium]
MSIRTANEADLPRLIELMAQLRPDEPEAEDPSCVEDYARVLARMTAQGQSVLVAEDDGRIAGALVLAIVENMVVDEAARGKRLGEALIEQAIVEAQRAGCYKLSLTSNKRRTEAHRFYERLGFVQTHEAFRIDL